MHLPSYPRAGNGRMSEHRGGTSKATPGCPQPTTLGPSSKPAHGLPAGQRMPTSIVGQRLQAVSRGRQISGGAGQRPQRRLTAATSSSSLRRPTTNSPRNPSAPFYPTPLTISSASRRLAPRSHYRRGAESTLRYRHRHDTLVRCYRWHSLSLTAQHYLCPSIID